MYRKKSLSWKNRVDAKNYEVKSYSTSKSYYIGDYIKHDYFGLGYIENSFGNKIEVLFEDKKRTLVHMVMF